MVYSTPRFIRQFILIHTARNQFISDERVPNLIYPVSYSSIGNKMENILQTNAIYLGLSLSLLLSACNDSNNPLTPFPGGKPGPILFVSNRSGTYQLYSMKPDGTNIRQITYNSNFPIYRASWSPDGSAIVVESTGGYQNYGPALYVFKADGTSMWRLTNPTSTNPNYASGLYEAWSPDSRRIAFSRIMIPEAVTNYEIFIINADATEEVKITNTHDTAEWVSDWSVDGKVIMGNAWAGGATPLSMAWWDLKGNLLRTIGQPDANFVHPRYSRKGDRIVYMSNKNLAQNIYVSNGDGTNETQVNLHFYQQYFPVDWSPDDSLILYNAGPTNYVSGDFGKIFLTNVFTKMTTDITPWNDSIYSYAVSWLRR